jgi:hypothetical protein
LLFIWGNAMIALAFLISCFFTSTRTATVFCYLLVFAMGLFGYLMMRFLLDLQPVVPGYVYWIDAMQIVPPLALYRCAQSCQSQGSRSKLKPMYATMRCTVAG